MHVMNKSVVGIFVGGLVLVAGLAVFLFMDCSGRWCGFLGNDAEIVVPSPVGSFEDCVAKGNPVMESYPRRCSDGKSTFLETVPVEPVGDPVVLEGLVANDKIASPVTLTGKALGTWFFEASFPVRIVDAEGTVLGTGIAEAKSDWMTTDYVPFTATITFSGTTTDTGFLEFVKDNPSGLPEHDASVRVPVRFK